MTKSIPFALLALLAAQGYLRPEEPSHIFAAGPTGAFYMEPPETASKAYARRLEWAADDSCLVVERLVPGPRVAPAALALARETPEFNGLLDLGAKTQLVAWNRRTRATTTLLEIDPSRTKLLGFQPMAGSDRFLVTLSEAVPAADGTTPWRTAYVLLMGAGSYARIWTESGSNGLASIELSPKRAVGELVVHASKGGDATVAFFGPDGVLARPLPIASHQRPSFAADGSPGMAVFGKDENGRGSRRFLAFDSQTGRLGKPVVEAGYEEPKPSPLTVSTRRNAEVRLNVAGGKAEESGIIAQDGAVPKLSPNDDAVAYLSGGGAYVRTLVKLDLKAYEALRTEAEKQRALRLAKEAGTAMSMYSQDFDAAFPPGGDIPNVVGPYARDTSSLLAFVYTFGGGVPGGELGGTEIGYVGGPGGRAVVYADGTVKWVPDAP